MSPEDLLAGPTVEEILKAPEYGTDGQEKEQLPADGAVLPAPGGQAPGGEPAPTN